MRPVLGGKRASPTPASAAISGPDTPNCNIWQQLAQRKAGKPEMALQLAPQPREDSGFGGIDEYPLTELPHTRPGQVLGVYITLRPDVVDETVDEMSRWFRGWHQVRITDSGVSDKQGFGFAMVEWLECDIDPLFLSILREEETVGDYTIYGRVLED
jgi:hypothetical protein